MIDIKVDSKVPGTSPVYDYEYVESHTGVYRAADDRENVYLITPWPNFVLFVNGCNHDLQPACEAVWETRQFVKTSDPISITFRNKTLD